MANIYPCAGLSFVQMVTITSHMVATLKIQLQLVLSNMSDRPGTLFGTSSRLAGSCLFQWLLTTSNVASMVQISKIVLTEESCQFKLKFGVDYVLMETR